MGRLVNAGPAGFKLESTTVWSFPEHGFWATHDSKWRGNWSPYVPRNLILRYSKEGDLILDQFAGSGTTLVEAKLLNRNCIGVDINEKALECCRTKTNFKPVGLKVGDVFIRKGDARDLNFIADQSIDFICTHPPYANIIKYSPDIENDLSLLDMPPFLSEMKKVSSECLRVLKKGKFCAVMMGDIRIGGNVQPLGFEVMNIFRTKGFILKEIIIKQQHNFRSEQRWKQDSIKYNFLLLAHEYLFVFRKPAETSF